MIMGFFPYKTTLFKEEVVAEYRGDIMRSDIIGLNKLLELFDTCCIIHVKDTRYFQLVRVH